LIYSGTVPLATEEDDSLVREAAHVPSEAFPLAEEPVPRAEEAVPVS
jgi:hypothetical protein